MKRKHRSNNKDKTSQKQALKDENNVGDHNVKKILCEKKIFLWIFCLPNISKKVQKNHM